MLDPVGDLVLDTHIWIWLVDGSSQLAVYTRQLIDRAARHASVLIPAICVWEVAKLETGGRLTLARNCRDWINEALAQPGIRLAPMSAEVALESCYLPGKLHQDPADRFIVATAKLHNATLVTRDKRLLKYASGGHVSAMLG